MSTTVAAFVLMVMFRTFPGDRQTDFVAMQRFETEEACKAAQFFIESKHVNSMTQCIKDVKPQQ